MNLILVGYRGSGKSTVGALVAKRLGRQFLDLDTLIMERAGQTIAQIFETEGEAGFRKREHEALTLIRRLKDHVIALGGGTLMDPENGTLAKRSGRIVWLRAPAVVLWSRIKADSKTKETRPNLTQSDDLLETEQLLAEREPAYARFSRHVIDTTSETPEVIAEAIELWFLASEINR